MIISRRWLADYVALPDSTAELTRRLTLSGLNLEEFHDVSDGLSQPDVAIDLEVTSNRPDCLGHIGVAREVSVLFQQPLQIPPASVTESGPAVSGCVSVSIDCEDLCPEYHARLIRGVRIGPSPAWLRDKLAAVGINSVNNVVDVTNYVMLECGQPLHAFDFDRLKGGRIVVRRARQGEKIQAIDQRDYELAAGMCVIADAERPVAVAGVMGGLDTEISDTTVNVLIESAAFSSLSVRATARTLRLHSPSSYRFERRTDRRNLDWASRRCCELILQLAGGSLLQGSVVAGTPLPPLRDPVRLRFDRVRQLLGVDIPSATCTEILQSLGLHCLEQSATEATFRPPGWRLDLTRECDLIEEIARIHGYEHIPTNAPLPVVATARTPRERILDTIRQHLTACGLYEALTLSFVSEAQRQLFQPAGELAPVAVSHSSRSHENQLRQSLIPSLLQCRRQNERHGTLNAELFEIARVYLAAGTGQPEATAEPLTVGIVTGRSFTSVLGLVESLVASLAPGATVTSSASVRPEFLNGRGAELRIRGEFLGWLGELSRNVLDASELHDQVCVAELRLPLLETLFQTSRSFTPLPRFPAVSRDLNFVLPEHVSWAELSQTVQQHAGPLLTETAFAGLYRGKQIATDHKSCVITCRFQSPERTLTAEEVDESVRRIIAACESKLAASLRA
ncbi:MAG: phenylalanine--tRNA ligase subunit beta [Planctomycetaceae bacterium]